MASDGSAPLGSTGSTPTCCRRPYSLAGPNGLQHLHGRDVERLRQRHADRHRAMPVLVEVLRHVEAEARRAVLDQRLGMGEAGLEGEAIDERLQGRARRAHGARSCRRRRSGHRRDSRATRRGRSPRRCGGRRRSAAADRRPPSAAACSRTSCSRLACACASSVRRCTRRVLFCSTSASARCGASIGNSRRTVGMRSALARSASSAVITPASAARSSTRLRARRAASREAVRPAQLRRLRQRHQQRRLGQRQPPRLLAEVGERGRAHALQIAAERRQPQVEAQDRVLGQARARAAARAAPGASCRRPCARARPAAGAPPAWSASSRRRRCGGARTSCQPARATATRIDAAMGAEALVLEGDQHGEIARIDVLGSTGSRQRPSAVV